MYKQSGAERRARAIKSLPAALLLNFTLILAVPGTIYFANLGEFSIDFSEFLLFSVPVLGLSTLILIGSGLCFSPSIHERALSFFLAVSLLLWLEANVIVWKYGQFDGRMIDWSDHIRNGLLDTPIWIAAILFAVFKSNLIHRFSGTIAAAFIGIQVVSLVSSVLTAERSAHIAGIKSIKIEQTNKFSFSSERNVILIVVDAFQGDIFDAITSNDSLFKELFDGFVYFENATAAGNYTEIAVPAILTGTVYDNSIPRSQYLQRSFLNRSLPKSLMDAGLGVHLFPWIGWGNESILFDEQIATNFVTAKGDSDRRPVFVEKNAKEVLHLYELSFFRSLPHFLKRVIFDGNGWLFSRLASQFAPDSLKKMVSTDSAFEVNTLVGNAEKKLVIETDQDIFKYYHTKGVHRPLVVNDTLEYGQETFDYSRETYIRQAKANLIYLGKFFDLLRSKNLFQNSMIIVVGDHGSGHTMEMYVQPTDRPVEVGAGLDILPPGNFQWNKAKGVPLILVKRFGESGKLKVSTAPVSTMDIKATVLSELGLDVDGGKSVFEIPENSGRIRYFSAISFESQKREFLPPITVYSIEGHSWADDSWSISGVRQSPGDGE